ncbi:MAG: mannonate dehydratase [Rhizobiaceae bacterium]
MRYTWRWFGPDDPVSLSDIRQAGASEIVTALHHVPNGEVWTPADIGRRRDEIEAAGLSWRVVESIPVSDAIKTGASGWEELADIWAESARNLAACGVDTICYNFMPVLDWTRTDLDHRLADGASCLRFDNVRFAAFDLFVLAREGAEADHDAATREAARAAFEAMDHAEIDRLTTTILAGLPGSEESFDLDSFRDRLADYAGVSPDGLRRNLSAFLARVLPQLADTGIRLAIHPDDPPRALFGLPRVVSTVEDMRAIAAMQEDVANGFTFCVGSYGVRADNPLAQMLREFGSRTHFLHLRATRREEDGLSFHEAAHLEGDADMVEIVETVLRIERERGEALPFRPDHGHAMLSDLRTDFRPGYPAIGRLRGMAEIRGLEKALARQLAVAS